MSVDGALKNTAVAVAGAALLGITGYTAVAALEARADAQRVKDRTEVLADDVKELRGDVKEILRRLPPR